MNFFKDFRKRLAWFGILLVAIFLSQTPMLTLAILTKIQFNPIWSTILVSLISILVLAIFLYGAHKSKLLDLKSKLLTINDLPRIVLSYLGYLCWKSCGWNLVTTRETNNNC